MTPFRRIAAALLLTGCHTVNDTSRAAAPTPDLQAMWDYGDPAGTEAKFRGLLPAVADADDRSLHAELLTQIARTRGLQRDFVAADELLDEAETMVAADMSRARVSILLERGRVRNSSGHADDARPLFLAAWELAREAGLDGLAVDAAHMLGIVEPPDESLRWNERAMALASDSSDPDARRWMGSLCNNIGWTYHGRGEYDRALDWFEQALAHRRERQDVANVRVARWCVARCLRSLERVEDALAIQRALEQETATTGSPDGFVQEEIAECLLALGRVDEARPYFRRAHELLSKDPWLADAEPERIERLNRMAGE